MIVRSDVSCVVLRMTFTVDCLLPLMAALAVTAVMLETVPRVERWRTEEFSQ